MLSNVKVLQPFDI